MISGRHTCGHKVCIDKKKKAHTKGYVGRQNLLLHIRNMHDGDEEASGFERKKAKVKNQQESAALVCAFSGPRYFCSCVPRILRRNACYRGWQPIHLDPSREIGYEIDICWCQARFRIFSFFQTLLMILSKTCFSIISCMCAQKQYVDFRS